MQRWEYMSLSVAADNFLSSGWFDLEELTNALNQHGEEGWELVSMFDTNTSNGQTRYVCAILKRPRA